MTLRLVCFHGAARRELRKAVDRYDDQVSGLGDEFAAEVEHSVQLIATRPQSGSPHRLGTRRLQVRRFPYGVVYAERNEEIVVLAIAHHRRRPEYWLRRVCVARLTLRGRRQRAVPPFRLRPRPMVRGSRVPNHRRETCTQTRHESS